MSSSGLLLRFCLAVVFIWSPLSWHIMAAPAMDIDVKVDDAQQTGCLYDGQLYRESETIVTKERCLNCSCQSGALRCQLQVCPFLHDVYPPPAGCVLVERKNACCPKLHCPSGPDGNRLLRKDLNGQKSAWKVREDLRKRLVDQLAKNGADNQGCVETGTLYAEGSAMMTSSTCEYCFCLKGKQTCVKPRCAEPVEGCTPKFRQFACCPTHYDCGATTNSTSVVTEKITPATAERQGATSSTSIDHHQKLIGGSRFFRKKILSKRSTDDKNQTSHADQELEESTAVTLGPDSLTDADDISPSTVSSKIHHQDSLAMEGSVIETKITPPTTIVKSTASPSELVTEEPTSKPDENLLVTAAAVADEEEPITEVDPPLSPHSRLDDNGHDLGLAVEEEDEEPSAAERGIEVSVSSSITSVSQSATNRSQSTGGNSASVIPVRPQQTSANILVVDNNKVAKPLPDAQSSSSLAPSQDQQDPLDYDYSNMELPPSLPNLEIIPFVAADAVMGVPNLEEDERLNLGGIADQHGSSHSSDDNLSSTEHCADGDKFYQHGEQTGLDDGDPCNVCRCLMGQIVCHQTQCAPLSAGCHRLERIGFCCGQVVCGNPGTKMEDRSDKLVNETLNDVGDASNSTKDKVEEQKVDVVTKLTDPIAAFRVTFPPRPASTLPPPPPPPTFPSRRTSTSRPTTFRPNTPSTPRSFSSSSIKFNKPANNNIIPPSFAATGGLRIDSCNIYGQMYRVGRIIDELSGPCVECKCTEIGVNCVNLKC